MAVVRLESGPRNADNYEYSWKSDSLRGHLLSNVGKKRTRNEDSCVICAPEDRQAERELGVLIAVADGMGGASGGDLASRLALEALGQRYYAGMRAGIPARLDEAIQDANRRVFEEAENRPEYYGMGTTVSALVIQGGNGYVAQVGDSRVYLTRGEDRLFQLTEDHSIVAEQVRNGFISEEEARNHSMKNLITRAVGIKQAVRTDLFAFKLREGDTLMICSDGLSNVVDEQEINRAMRLENLQGGGRMLVGRALEGGGPDNITVALVRVMGIPYSAKLHPGAMQVALGKPGLLGRLRGLFS